MDEAKRRNQATAMPMPPFCVFCCERPATTRDHVPPRGIFVPPLPPDLITVPACMACNNGASGVDERFRTMLSIRVGSGSDATRQLRDTTVRGLQRHHQQRQELAARVRRGIITAPDGAEHTVGLFPWPAESHDPIITKITRGLYYHEFRTPLRPEVPVEPSYFQPHDADVMEVFHQGIARGLGSPFEYAFLHVPELPATAMIWVYRFYGGAHMAGAVTGTWPED